LFVVESKNIKLLSQFINLCNIREPKKITNKKYLKNVIPRLTCQNWTPHPLTYYDLQKMKKIEIFFPECIGGVKQYKKMSV